ncbi:DUF6838 family protein [Chryseomicrobium palamuruense]|uniref:DUF6838 family protein n=1 Tax=Chryseomicrobium palamuruense TaxID=682973 RepID=A0ABV8UXS9_9BACL
MINHIVDAVSIAIDSEFNETADTYTIYTESLEQGLKEPCFFIFCINPTNDLFLNKRYFRSNQFCIQYFPSTHERKAEINAVIERLYNCLDVVTVNGDLTRGMKMTSEMVDGVLNFFVNYDMFIYKVEAPQDMMDSVNVNSDAKG